MLCLLVGLWGYLLIYNLYIFLIRLWRKMMIFCKILLYIVRIGYDIFEWCYGSLRVKENNLKVRRGIRVC